VVAVGTVWRGSDGSIPTRQCSALVTPIRMRVPARREYDVRPKPLLSSCCDTTVHAKGGMIRSREAVIDEGWKHRRHPSQRLRVGLRIVPPFFCEDGGDRRREYSCGASTRHGADTRHGMTDVHVQQGVRHSRLVRERRRANAAGGGRGGAVGRRHDPHAGATGRIRVGVRMITVLAKGGAI